MFTCSLSTVLAYSVPHLLTQYLICSLSTSLVHSVPHLLTQYLTCSLSTSLVHSVSHLFTQYLTCSLSTSRVHFFWLKWNSAIDSSIKVLLLCTIYLMICFIQTLRFWMFIHVAGGVQHYNLISALIVYQQLCVHTLRRILYIQEYLIRRLQDPITTFYKKYLIFNNM